MFTKHLVDKALLTLEIGDKTALFILLSKDGAINRKGNGSPLVELPLCRGISHDGHFEAFMMTVNENIFGYSGVLKMPERLGNECRLTIIFQGSNGVDISFRVVYGDRSQGPPAELAEILINAVKITEPWYQKQQLTAPGPEKENEKSNWWPFWK